MNFRCDSTCQQNPMCEKANRSLALLPELYSRRIVGWSLKSDRTECLVLACLRTAIRKRQPAAGLIYHTERGGQYAGNSYRAVMRRSQMRDCMSRADNWYDNAFVESGIGAIRNELEMTVNKTIHDALKESSSYVRYYNVERKHSAIECRTPVKFEQLQRCSK
jgi:putative transposase